MTDKEWVLSKFPTAECKIECCTDMLEDWQGPALYEYIVRANDKPLGDYAAYPERAWAQARMEQES